MLRILAVVLFLGGCAADKVADSRPVDPSRPIAFIDSDVFDNDVARTLSVTPDKVTVKPVAPMTVNAVPSASMPGWRRCRAGAATCRWWAATRTPRSSSNS